VTGFDPEITLAELRLFVGRLVELGAQGKSVFVASWRDQEAAQMLITKLAEASGRLPETAKVARPGVPWRQIQGMRNRLVHAYHAVDLDVLWETVATDAPSLLTALNLPA
jgi:uncharacterized protein with HEPN domain